MIKAGFILFATLFLISLSGKGQTKSASSRAELYKTKRFDAALFPSEYNSLMKGERFTPTKTDVEKAEKALRSDLEKINKDLVNQSSSPKIHKKLKKYKRQYFGVIDEKGNRILLINCFWAKNQNISTNWLKSRIVVMDGGSYYWHVKYNLDTRKLFELVVNGYS